MSGPPQTFGDEETKELLLSILKRSPPTKQLLSSLASVISDNNIPYNQLLLHVPMSGRSVRECEESIASLLSAGSSQNRSYSASQTTRPNFPRQSFPQQTATFRPILSKPATITSVDPPAPQPPVNTPRKRGRPKKDAAKTGDTPESLKRRDSASRERQFKKSRPTSGAPLQIKPSPMDSARSSIGTNAEIPTPLASAGPDPFSPSFPGYPDPRGPSATSPYTYPGPRAPQTSSTIFPPFPSEPQQMIPQSRPPEPRTLWPSSMVGLPQISQAPLSRPQTAPAQPPTILPPPPQSQSLPLPPPRYADPPSTSNAPSGTGGGDSMEQ